MASNALAYTSLLSSASAQAAVVPPGGALKCLITIEGAIATAAVRMRSDGTAPTATVGHYMTPGKDYTLDWVSGATKFINDTAASTNCTIHFHWTS